MHGPTSRRSPAIHIHVRAQVASPTAAALPALGEKRPESYLGTVAGPTGTYESLDYEEADNTVYRSSHAASTPWDSVRDTSLKWSICFLIGERPYRICRGALKARSRRRPSLSRPSSPPSEPGTTTAAAAFAVNLSVENIAAFKFWATLTALQSHGYLGSFLLYTSINGALVLLSVLVTLFIGPAAAGSGIGEVKVMGGSHHGDVAIRLKGDASALKKPC